jgi:hypothetical protein
VGDNESKIVDFEELSGIESGITFEFAEVVGDFE